MYNELNGKCAVITGAAGGLGRAVVRRLFADGLRLVLIDRDLDPLRSLAGELGAGNDRCLVLAADVTRKSEVDSAVEQAVSTFGALDIAVHVAGGFRFGTMAEASEADWDFLFDLNAKSAFFLSAAATRAMVARGTAGRVILVGARAALQGAAGIGPYCASKAAVLRLTESLAAEMRDHKITVNAILPSVIDTPANRKAMPDADPASWVAPESLADVIAFLVSDGARDISGASIPVYGRA